MARSTAEVTTPTRLPSASRAEPGAGHARAGLEREPLQDLVDVAEGVDPGHGLLAEVAALDEADRPVVAGELLGQVLLGDVLAEDRRPRLDPQGLELRGLELDQAPAPAAALKASTTATTSPRSPITVRPGQAGAAIRGRPAPGGRPARSATWA